MSSEVKTLPSNGLQRAADYAHSPVFALFGGQKREVSSPKNTQQTIQSIIRNLPPVFNKIPQALPTGGLSFLKLEDLSAQSPDSPEIVKIAKKTSKAVQGPTKADKKKEKRKAAKKAKAAQQNVPPSPLPSSLTLTKLQQQMRPQEQQNPSPPKKEELSLEGVLSSPRFKELIGQNSMLTYVKEQANINNDQLLNAMKEQTASLEAKADKRVQELKKKRTLLSLIKQLETLECVKDDPEALLLGLGAVDSDCMLVGAKIIDDKFSSRFFNLEQITKVETLLQKCQEKIFPMNPS